MARTLVIAELGSSWRFGNDHLASAEKMIREAKACGADVAKFQWTSDPRQMAARRYQRIEKEIEAGFHMYRQYLEYDQDWLPKLKSMCDEAGIEFMCTVYLPQDIPVIAPLVKRFKVSAFERNYDEFLRAHNEYTAQGKPVIVSCWKDRGYGLSHVNYHYALYCVSEYPTPIEKLGLSELLSCRDMESPFSGLSDHTTSTLTGALAVAAGATILEKHVRLWDTPQDNPDYGHSLILDSDGEEMSFAEYVRNVREAERCM